MQLQLQDDLLKKKKQTQKIVLRKQSASNAITDRKAALFTTFS